MFEDAENTDRLKNYLERAMLNRAAKVLYVWYDAMTSSFVLHVQQQQSRLYSIIKPVLICHFHPIWLPFPKESCSAHMRRDEARRPRETASLKPTEQPLALKQKPQATIPPHSFFENLIFWAKSVSPVNHKKKNKWALHFMSGDDLYGARAALTGFPATN